MPVLGISISIAFFLTFWLVVRMALPANDRDILNLMVGCISTNFTTIIGYYYVSSKSQDQLSDNNQQLIAALSMSLRQRGNTEMSNSTAQNSQKPSWFANLRARILSEIDKIEAEFKAKVKTSPDDETAQEHLETAKVATTIAVKNAANEAETKDE